MLHELIDFVSEQFRTNQFFSAAALSLTGTGFLYQLRSVPNYIATRLHRRFHYSVTLSAERANMLYKFAGKILEEKYADKFRKLEMYIPISAFNSVDKSEDLDISKSQVNDHIFIWKNRRRIRLTASRERLEAANDTYNMYERNYTVSGYFAKKAINSFVSELVREGYTRLKEEAEKKFRVYVKNLSKHGDWYSAAPLKGKRFNELFLNEKYSILEDLSKFREALPEYNKLGIPFKRGYLFYGQPGNGKSAMAAAIAFEMNYDLHILDLANIDANAFKTALADIQPGSILLIEDIDSFYDKRKQSKENKIPFSTFINSLSGVAAKDNIITIFTTNDISKLDPALLRAGRCDVKVELSNPTKELVEEFLKTIYKKEITLPDSFKPKHPFVQIQNFVITNLHDADECVRQILK